MSEVDVSKCPYYGECGIVNNCTLFEQCRVKELFDDFYKVEKLYMNSKNKLQRLKAENEKLQDSLGLANKYLNKYKQCLDEIEETVKDFHLSMIIFHNGTTHKMADRIDDYLDEIKQLIKQAKEGKE